MKQLLFLSFLLTSWAFTAQSQMQQGSWMLDGQIGITQNSIEGRTINSSGIFQASTSRGSNYYLRPAVGYFLKDHWSLGLISDFQFVNGAVLDENGSELAKGGYRIYGIGVFTRKYFPIEDKLSFYGELRISQNWGKFIRVDVETSERSTTGKLAGFDAGASLGIQYQVADFLGVHLQSSLIQLDQLQQENEQAIQISNRKELNLGLFSNFQIGATVFF